MAGRSAAARGASGLLLAYAEQSLSSSLTGLLVAAVPFVAALAGRLADRSGLVLWRCRLLAALGALDIVQRRPHDERLVAARSAALAAGAIATAASPATIRPVQRIVFDAIRLAPRLSPASRLNHGAAACLAAVALVADVGWAAALLRRALAVFQVVFACWLIAQSYQGARESYATFGAGAPPATDARARCGSTSSTDSRQARWRSRASSA